MTDSTQRRHERPPGATRVLLFTGKGGVGKTTTAAATALHIARSGKRVVVTSADPAHSLGDSLGVDLGSDPRRVAERCWAQQLDGRERLEENWAEIRDWLVELFDWAGVDDIAAEELAILPGLDEMFALTEIDTLARTGDYDVIVVDCAPTAETIRLLSLPEVLGWYMDRFFPTTRRLNRVVGPVLARLGSVPVADDSVLMAGKRFYDRIDTVRELLCDPTRTSVRMVLNPESMVLAEARRTHTYLSMFGYQVDAVVVNRVVPDLVGDGEGAEWLRRWREGQARNLAEVEESFADVARFRAAHGGVEVLGIENLERFAADLWGGVDPTDRLSDGRPMTMGRDGDDLILSVAMPFTEGSEVDLSRNGDDLFIAHGPHRRCLTLPDSLARREVTAATVEDGALTIRFT